VLAVCWQSLNMSVMQTDGERKSEQPIGTDATGNSSNLLYTDQTIQVTQTRLIIGNASYTVASISSLRIVAIKPNQSAFQWPSAFAGFFLFMGVLFLAFNSHPDSHIPAGLFFLLLGGILTFVAVNVRKRSKPTFGLRITTTAQEQQVFSSPNLETLHSIELALQRAIDMRG